MKDFEHLMTVWQGQPVKEQLSVDEALKQVKKGISGLSHKLIWGIVGIVLTTALVVYLTLFGAFVEWTSQLGLVILIVGTIMYLALQIGDYRTISKHDPTTNPVLYLEMLKIYQKRRAYLFGRFWYLYGVIVTAGLSLFSFEILERLSIQVRIICYIAWVAYLLFATYYLKDRIIKTEKEKVSLMIGRLERLKEQFIHE